MRRNRPRAGAQTFRLTQTKRTVLDLLAEYFCLRTKDVARLLRDREPTENDFRSARRTLTLLWKQGLLHRVTYFELNGPTGGIHYVYGLSDKGVREFGGKTFDEHSLRTLDHELEISFFHIALDSFAESHGPEVYWQQSELKRGIHPDALFALTHPQAPEGHNTNYFFLEVERQRIGSKKNGEPSIVRKLQRYADYYDTDQCQRDWAFRKYRVIVVQQDNERRADARRRNLLAVLKEKLPYKMFWLTTDKLYQQNIGANVFMTPRDYESMAYSLHHLWLHSSQILPRSGAYSA